MHHFPFSSTSFHNSQVLSAVKQLPLQANQERKKKTCLGCNNLCFLLCVACKLLTVTDTFHELFPISEEKMVLSYPGISKTISCLTKLVRHTAPCGKHTSPAHKVQ